ncbi:MAG: efflux RND transporter periplasmic adaptor subunit, partial [Chromatiaceae bacterium]|nr:efflux RND transporter periplasmic adaptor subunit [Chromatiaceae bacterium]
KQAAVDRLRILEQQTQVVIQNKALAEAEAQLQLLLNGSTAEEIEMARQEVAEAEAALRRLRQSLEHSEARLSGTRLRMPFSGYLVDAYLNQKVGLYLTEGTTFATAQAKRRPLVEMVLPESEVAALKVGAAAEIRLLAHAEQPFPGRVAAIEPTGSATAFGQSFKVLVELLDAEGALLRPGMTGYGKIESGHKPLYIQLSRPLARFAAIELWSWFP